ncbi:hypothetical protein AVEN_157047-1 [Araneus ventricosus]|uniref:Uncharacterized protein n=1 Tax=Araneus ventricosus TaxID=182803 RepID=A0A4Y2RNA3_ARAVE|nr:hypothetical protein AVEN_157047-1 [Araneus ventricosus]
MSTLLLQTKANFQPKQVILLLFCDRGGLVVRKRLWCRRVPGLKPDSAEDPPCMGPVYQYILSGQAYEAMSRWIRSHRVSKRVLACPASIVVEGAELPLTDDGRYSSIVPHALRQAWGGTSFVVPIFAKYHNTDLHHCFSE